MSLKRISVPVFIIIFMSFQSCDTTTEPSITTDLGEVSLSILFEGVGSLSKTMAIDLENLYIELSTGTTVILDTVAVSGNSQIIVNNSYTDLVAGAWSVKAESKDANDVVIHSDSTTFTVIADNTVDVSLSLTSKYSMLIANFVGIADSVTRCELLVDATMVADSSFAAQSGVGSTLSLSYDYLSTGEQHTILLDAYGDMWGTEHLLYTGDTTVTVVSGVDTSFTISLLWVGPNEAPSGTASVEITIGPTGTVTVNGDFPITVTDIDGNVYETIQIGDQVWMAENLKVTHYRDGTPITHVTDNTLWVNLSTEAYCIYNNNAGNELDTYGALYNWYAVNGDIDGDGIKDKELAPAGWHVSTRTEWQVLVDYWGGYVVAGGPMKEAGTTHWNDPNTGATNESGFTALPAGFRIVGQFEYLGYRAHFWLATQHSTVISAAWDREMHYNYSVADLNANTKHNGFSVRCVRD